MNVAIFKPGQQAQYLTSINGAEYLVDVDAKNPESNDPDIFINPDISQVKNVPIKYWKVSGKSIVEMDQMEKDAILAKELQQRRVNADNFQADTISTFTALIKVINLRLPVGQKITKAELVTAIKEEIS